MTDGPLLLKAVLDHPDEDTPRLLYADVLDEAAGAVPCGACGGKGSDNKFMRATDRFRGKTGPSTVVTTCPACSGSGRVGDGRAARAEFIRVQVELARKGESEACEIDPNEGHTCTEDPCRVCESVERYDGLRRRARELLDGPNAGFTNKTQWFTAGRRELATGFTPEFRRGFVESLTCTSAAWLAHADAVLAAHPVREVAIADGAWPGLQALLNAMPDNPHARALCRVNDDDNPALPSPVTGRVKAIFGRVWPAIRFDVRLPAFG